MGNVIQPRLRLLIISTLAEGVLRLKLAGRYSQSSIAINFLAKHWFLAHIEWWDYTFRC